MQLLNDERNRTEQDTERELRISAKLIRRGRFFLDYLSANGIMPPTEVAEPLEKAYARIVSYLAGDSDFPKPRGIFIAGPTGCGKTTLVRAFTDCARIHVRKRPSSRGIVFLRAREMTVEYTTNEYYLPYLHNLTSQKTVIIDDLGIEHAANRYGVPWGLEEYLEERYETWTEYGAPTILTTNYQRPDAILNRYGERAFSRLAEMVDFIAYNYRDRRMQQ